MWRSDSDRGVGGGVGVVLQGNPARDINLEGAGEKKYPQSLYATGIRDKLW